MQKTARSYHLNVAGFYNPSLEGFTKVGKIEKLRDPTVFVLTRLKNELSISAHERDALLLHRSLLDTEMITTFITIIRVPARRQVAVTSGLTTRNDSIE